MTNVRVKPISEIEEKSEVWLDDKILILDADTEEARLASKDELKGDKGDPWEQWEPWPQWEPWSQGIPWKDWEDWKDGNWIASITSSKVWKTTTVTITETNGNTDSFQILDWEDWGGSGSWDVVWPTSSTDGHLAVFDWATWKVIKDWWAMPTIPTKVSDLTNDAGYITSSYHDSTKQNVLTAGTNIEIQNNVISATGWADIEYVTQAEYNALLPWAESDGKHYFIYTPSVVPPTPSVYTITWSTVSWNYTPWSFSDIQGCYVSPDGTKMYIDFWNNWNGKLAQYSLSTPRDITTASQVTSIWVTQPDGLYFDDDGNYFYVSCEQDHTIKRYSMSTAWDISTAAQDQSLSIGSSWYAYNICLSEDGSYIYYNKWAGNIFQYELATPYDLTTATNQKSITLSNDEALVMVKDNWKYLYSWTEHGESIKQYELATPYDITSNRTEVWTYSFGNSADWRWFWVSNDCKYRMIAMWSSWSSVRMLEAQPM